MTTPEHSCTDTQGRKARRDIQSAGKAVATALKSSGLQLTHGGLVVTKGPGARRGAILRGRPNVFPLWGVAGLRIKWPAILCLSGRLVEVQVEVG